MLYLHKKIICVVKKWSFNQIILKCQQTIPKNNIQQNNTKKRKKNIHAKKNQLTERLKLVQKLIHKKLLLYRQIWREFSQKNELDIPNDYEEYYNITVVFILQYYFKLYIYIFILHFVNQIILKFQQTISKNNIQQNNIKNQKKYIHAKKLQLQQLTKRLKLVKKNFSCIYRYRETYNQIHSTKINKTSLIEECLNIIVVFILQ
eukprot:TRINITY_DN48245_c1_g1_i1.p2 TRINITY_DN48245_c1_g1~~TRINITY_DN48245_c1_g1_i1.p2  ORF type:complete len:204 (+),score=-9.99 TRINITY_DN48245_c1_g1_i1:81-692(+)